MAQACLTQYFTPKRSRRSSTILASGDSIKSQKRKIKTEDENDENVCSLSVSSKRKRRISKAKFYFIRKKKLFLFPRSNKTNRWLFTRV
jgi:hypothetical protein